MGKAITQFRRWRKLQARRRMLSQLQKDLVAKEQLTLSEKVRCGTAIRVLAEYIEELKNNCTLEAK